MANHIATVTSLGLIVIPGKYNQNHQPLNVLRGLSIDCIANDTSEQRSDGDLIHGVLLSLESFLNSAGCGLMNELGLVPASGGKIRREVFYLFLSGFWSRLALSYTSAWKPYYELVYPVPD